MSCEKVVFLGNILEFYVALHQNVVVSVMLYFDLQGHRRLSFEPKAGWFAIESRHFNAVKNVFSVHMSDTYI